MAQLLRAQGLTRVVTLGGGYTAWRGIGGEIANGDGQPATPQPTASPTPVANPTPAPAARPAAPSKKPQAPRAKRTRRKQ